jgi:hypothetical protein
MDVTDSEATAPATAPPGPPDRRWLGGAAWRVVGARGAEALTAGLLGALFVCGWIAEWRVMPYPLGTSDFQDYCTAVAAYREARWDAWPMQRSVLAGLLPGALSVSFGVLRGLVYGSLISTVLWIAGTWVWTWSLAGRRAAWLAVAWIGAFGPLVLLTRTVSFYPEVAVLHVAAAACAAGAIARGHWGWSMAGAVSLGLLPLADVRSVIVLGALAPAMLLGAVLARAGWGARAGLVVLQAGALCAAWRWGTWSYPAESVATVQSTVYHYAEDAARLTGVTWKVPAWETSAPFAWARTDIASLVDAVRYLQAVDASRPPLLARLALQTANGREVAAWVQPTALAALLAVLGLLHRPRAVLALFATAPVFFVLLRSAALTLPHPRQLALGSAALPVVFGAGSAALLFGLDALQRRAAARRPAATEPSAAPRAPRVGRIPRVVPAVALTACVAGWILSVSMVREPVRAIGQRMSVDDEPASSLRRARAGELYDVTSTCARILANDARNGHSLDLPVFREPAARPTTPAAR